MALFGDGDKKQHGIANVIKTYRRRWSPLLSNPRDSDFPGRPASLTSFGVAARKVRTPVDAFLEGRRKAFRPLHYGRLPARVYVDQKTILRDIVDMRQLGKGDHCMITLNVLRCCHPWIDWFVSLLGALELFHFYHHFIVLDDVAILDEYGIPRTSEGKIVAIMEYGNTIPMFLEEVRIGTSGRWWKLPLALLSCFGNKAHCHSVPLADYGDMPHILRIEEKLSDHDRNRIVEDAQRLIDDHPKYNFLWANCEHTANLVSAKQQFASPLCRFAFWILFRFSLHLIGLSFLRVLTTGCYMQSRFHELHWAFFGYQLMIPIPVALQSLITFMKLTKNVWSCYLSSLIAKDEFYHILVKELFRMLCSGGVAVCVTAQAPYTILLTCQSHSAMVYFIVLFVYFVSDMIYSLTCQVVTRSLVCATGRFWFIGGAPLACSQEQARLAKAR